MALTASLLNLQLLSPGSRGREYVSGGGDRAINPLLEQALQVLTQFQDDLNKEFGDTVYDDMMKDSAVSASVDILKSLILSESLRVVPAVSDKKDPDYEEAKKIADFVTRQFKGMTRPLHSVLWEMLDAIQYGASLVEIVYEPDQDPIEKRIIYKLKDLKTRSRKNYAFLVDRWFNVIGAVNTESGFTGPGAYVGEFPDPTKLIPRAKFVHLVLNTKNGDPRGLSMLRAAYNAYYVKTQAWPQYLKFIIQFASPSLVGFTPELSQDIEELDENGDPVINDDGTPKTITPEEDMLATLLGFQGGTVAVLKGGSKLDALYPKESSGTAFTQAIEIFDRQIAMAILKTHRTLLEAKHGSKADSEASADITDVFVGGIKEVVSGAITKDAVYQLVEINYGPEKARRFSPEVTLKSLPKQDFAKAASAVASLWTAKFLHNSQVGEIDAMLGLPERDMDAFLSEMEDEVDMRRMDQVERMKLMNPGSGEEPPPGGDPKKDDEPKPKDKKEAA